MVNREQEVARLKAGEAWESKLGIKIPDFFKKSGIWLVT